ncbi:MAG: ADP-ribosylation factor-like protein [Promethearchaeota archaeon]
MSSFKLKVLLTGPKAIDKSNLVQKIVKKKFQTNYKLTVGVDILIKEVEYRQGEIATLSIWDIGRQQRFDIIRNTFYKGATGVILIFDLTREHTFVETRKLLTEIRQFTGPIPFILIGNNVKLFELTDIKGIRDVARKFARNEGGIYIEMSLTNKDIVEEAFRELTRKIIGLRN